jgi:hypothetical protein
VTFRHRSRYRSYQAKPCARWYARGFDVVALTKAAITEVIPTAPAQAFVMEARLVSKSGPQTYGLERCGNGPHSRAEKGLAISALGGLDIPDNCAYILSVEHPPPTPPEADEEQTRIDPSWAQLLRVVQPPDLSPRPSVITDGYDSKTPFIAGVRALTRQQMGKRRAEANRRSLYEGPQRAGPGRPNISDGTVRGTDLARCERLDVQDEHRGLSHQGVNQVQVRGNLRGVLVVDTQTPRRAVLFSTDVTLDVRTRYRYDTARFQVEWLCREATQLTGLSDGQARLKATLDVHFTVRVTALPLATLEARQPRGSAEPPFSMASLNRRALTPHLSDRMGEHFARGRSLEKASPDDEQLSEVPT